MCGVGGIGRRRRLKISRLLQLYGFESHTPYKTQNVMKYAFYFSIFITLVACWDSWGLYKDLLKASEEKVVTSEQINEIMKVKIIMPIIMLVTSLIFFILM